MPTDNLERDLYAGVCAIPLIDPHSHIDPHRPNSRGLDDILGYHYYTELAHSAGMGREPLAADVPPRERVRAILAHMDRFDNTAQYSWFLEIARRFLGHDGDRIRAADADALFDAAERTFTRPGWEDEVLRRSNVERVFLTNEFDDPLENFDTKRYVPCLRTDALVFHLHTPEVRQRLAKAAGVEPTDAGKLRQALGRLFDHFTRKGAKACAISLPPDFAPGPVGDRALSDALASAGDERPMRQVRTRGVFWAIAELCREYRLPLDLMIGVNR